MNYHFEDNKGDVLLSTSFMAGLIAGFAEAMLFVTPLEVIKITVLNDMSRPVPNHNSVKSVLWDIVKKHGIIKFNLNNFKSILNNLKHILRHTGLVYRIVNNNI